MELLLFCTTTRSWQDFALASCIAPLANETCLELVSKILATDLVSAPPRHACPHSFNFYMVTEGETLSNSRPSQQCSSGRGDRDFGELLLSSGVHKTLDISWCRQ